MGTDSFRRHARACVDASIHAGFRAFAAAPAHLAFYARLVASVRARTACPRTLGSLQQLVPFEAALVREPETWSGAAGHPLHVVHSLTSHLFARYPVPRCFASVWLEGADAVHGEWRRWVVEYGHGRAFRRIAATLALTRRMEDELLHTPDHLAFTQGLRRAEVRGLGGAPALVDVLLTTRLAEHCADAARWRVALAWLVGCGDAIEVAQVPPLIDYLHAQLHDICLRGRTFASTMRLVEAWHTGLGGQRIQLLTWAPSRWQGLQVPAEATGDEHAASEWTVVELCDSYALQREGRVLRHCVATYAARCAAGWTSIWSLRRQWARDERAVPELTIEVHPRLGAIVQVRGKRNGPATPAQLAIVQRWAARQQLTWRPGW